MPLNNPIYEVSRLFRRSIRIVDKIESNRD